MHFAFVNRYKINKNGGAENWVKEIANILIENGHKVDIITPKDDEIVDYKKKGLMEIVYESKIYNLFKKIGILNFFFFLVSPTNKINLKDYDAVYVTSFLHLFIFLKTQRKFIIGTHDFFISNDNFTIDFPLKILELLLFILCKNPRIYLHSLNKVVSESLTTVCKNKLIEIGNNGLFDYTAIPLGDDNFNILFLGKVEKRKGADLLIDLLEILPNLNKTKLWVVGEIDSNYKSILEKAKSDKIIVTGFVDEIEKRKILSKSSCFLFFSNREVFPLTVTEGLKYGLPIVSTWKPLNKIQKDEIILECSFERDSVMKCIYKLKEEWDDNKEDYFEKKLKRAKQFSEKTQRPVYERAILDLFAK